MPLPAASSNAFMWSITMRVCCSNGRSGNGGGGRPAVRAARNAAQYSASKGGSPET